MNRRQLLALAGTGGVGLAVGYALGGSLDLRSILGNGERYQHEVRVSNARETTHEVRVESEFEGDQVYGPRTLKPDENWEVTRYEDRGDVTIRFYVDDDLVWLTTHEIPNPYGTNGYSMVGITLTPEDEVDTYLQVTD